MKIPKTFLLGGSKWTVEEVSKLDNCGLTLRDECSILIRKELPIQVREQTFCHELIHAIKYAMGDQDHNEKEVEAMGHLLHQFFKTVK